MDVAHTTTPVAGPNIPTALVLAMPPPPVPAVAIFVDKGAPNQPMRQNLPALPKVTSAQGFGLPKSNFDIAW
uniref:Uncharacterized protein n=1 Tax=Romanomermis culicivorax TaxID=13658 RepID=A0A915KSR6_ROMCU